jgi:hypothetical protein
MSTQYEIRIACGLSEAIFSTFSEMRAVELSPTSTLLTGEMRDQSDLHGLLARIADLDIDIIEVRAQP